MTTLRQQLTRSCAEEGMAARAVAPEPPADRDMLRATLVGRISGICRGFSMPDDADHAMRDICDALIAYHNERAKSFGAESGPFCSTFAIYADEARADAQQISLARKRWRR